MRRGRILQEDPSGEEAGSTYATTTQRKPEGLLGYYVLPKVGGDLMYRRHAAEWSPFEQQLCEPGPVGKTRRWGL